MDTKIENKKRTLSDDLAYKKMCKIKEESTPQSNDIEKCQDQEEITRLISCDICLDVCKRGVVVKCCNSQACRVCAARIQQSSMKCWSCNAEINETSLEVDYDLRQVVLEYINKEAFSRDSLEFLKKKSSTKKSPLEKDALVVKECPQNVSLSITECQTEDIVFVCEKNIINNESPITSTGIDHNKELIVFVTIEGKLTSKKVSVFQLAAICSDSDKSFHNVMQASQYKVFHDFSQKETVSTNACRLNFIEFLLDIIDHQKNLNKSVTLMFYSKFELAMFLNWDEQHSDDWQRHGLFELAYNNVKLVWMSMEGSPKELSYYTDDYHDSMLEAAKIFKDFVHNIKSNQKWKLSTEKFHTCLLSTHLVIQNKKCPIISCMRMKSKYIRLKWIC